jgi:hypothetical protein
LIGQKGRSPACRTSIVADLDLLTSGLHANFCESTALRSWKIGLSVVAMAAMVIGVAVWLSYPKTSRRFDTSSNGLWISHRWYTGHEVRTDEVVAEIEISQLVARLRRAGIRYVYVHVGPLQQEGSIEDSASTFFMALRGAYPEGVFLAWLGARLEKVRLGEPSWRRAVVEQIVRLREEEFDGVHFNLEPLRDGHPGYLELLSEVRERFGPEWIISQATPRSAPFGVAVGPLQRSFWSGGFYRATMDIADQTVLMAYDARLFPAFAYVAFVRDQTRRLVEWACNAHDHEVLIGIPSYAETSAHSDPEIENITNATQGVRAALESLPGAAECFRGVAIYSDWVTDADEWRQFDRGWRHGNAH